MEIVNLRHYPGGVFRLTELIPGQVKEIQYLLSLRGFYKGEIDGIAGAQTQEAFADFKESIWLDSPDLIGPSTVASLLEILEDHKVSEQSASATVSENAGSRTGRSLVLVNGQTVFQNEFIVPGIPLTWGEMTKNCDPERNPLSVEIISNIIITAKGFGEIREKYGSAIGVTSGYRPPAVNRRVGGARNSQHIQGLAIDICPIDGNLNRLLEVVRASKCVGIGRGMRRGFIHCDWRDGARVIFDY